MEAAELLAQALKLWATDDAALVALAESEYGHLAERAPNPEDAETCRLTALSCIAELDTAAMVVWRARAFSRCAAIGWTCGVAALVMSDAFRILGMANNNYPGGHKLDVVHGDAQALAVIEELEVLLSVPDRVDVPFGPNPRLVRRWHCEKRAFLLLVSRRYDEALAWYDAAAQHVEQGSRGSIRVQLGREQTRYLAAPAQGRDGTEPTAVTGELAAVAAAALQADIARLAGQNHELMLAGRVDLLPYEML